MTQAQTGNNKPKKNYFINSPLFDYSENVTCLLNKANFETLIGSIEQYLSSQQNQGTSSFGYMQAGKIKTMIIQKKKNSHVFFFS